MPETRPEIRAAREPLTPTEFKRALEQGLGRAILCLQKHDPAPYKKIVLEACLFDSTYDSHCGETKAAYLLECLNSFEDGAVLKTRVLKRFLRAPLNDPDRPDPKLVLEMAKAQFPDARAVLYKQFFSVPPSEFNWRSGREIVDLDGLAGLLEIAPLFGAALQNNPDFEPPWFHLRDLIAEHGRESILAAFRERSNPPTNLYLEHALAKIAETYVSPKYAELPLHWAIDEIYGRGNNNRVSLMFWGEAASDENLLAIATSTEDWKSSLQMLLGLSVFERRPFPLNHLKLIPFLWHEDEYIVWQAAKALSYFSDSHLRKMSLQLRRNSSTVRASLLLLEQNLLEEDWDWLEKLTRSLTDAETELLNVGICDVIEANSSPRAQTTLIQLYESGSCAMCRSRMTELLHELECVPDWMLEELLKDSYDYIREKARAWATAA